MHPVQTACVSRGKTCLWKPASATRGPLLFGGASPSARGMPGTDASLNRRCGHPPTPRRKPHRRSMARPPARGPPGGVPCVGASRCPSFSFSSASQINVRHARHAIGCPVGGPATWSRALLERGCAGEEGERALSQSLVLHHPVRPKCHPSQSSLPLYLTATKLLFGPSRYLSHRCPLYTPHDGDHLGEAPSPRLTAKATKRGSPSGPIRPRCLGPLETRTTFGHCRDGTWRL